MTPNEKFQYAIEFVLAHEGRFVDDPDDPGGATNWGVSLRFLKSVGDLDLDGDGFSDYDLDRDGDIDADDTRAMTRDQAKGIYRRHWWDRLGYGQLPAAISVKVFDHAVNMGSVPAHKALQRAVRSCGIHLADDGIIGPKTRKAVRVFDQRDLLSPLCSEVAGHYRLLIAVRPKFEKYRDGWMNRAYHRPFSEVPKS